MNHLKQAVASAPGNARAHYKLGTFLLNEVLSLGEIELLADARAALAEAARLAPERALFHAMLGYALECDETTVHTAAACFDLAHQLEPDNALFETYLVTLLVESMPDRQALPRLEAAAKKHGVDLEDARHQLRAAGFPVNARNLLKNAFIHARNHFASMARREAARIEKHYGAASPEEIIRRESEEWQQSLRKSVRRGLVPKAFRPLTPLAQKIGIGDDGCRAYATGQLKAAEARELAEQVQAHAAAIQQWLDSFSEQTLPEEASAFLYLLLAAEELSALHGNPTADKPRRRAPSAARKR